LTSVTAADTISSAMTETASLPGEPASIGARIGAGVLDAIALAVIGGALYYIPLRFGALALPLLGAMVAILVWDIVPCAFFRGTLAMRLFDLELIGIDGRRADLGELLSRELLGRGMIGFAYYSTALIGLVGYLSGSITFFQPRGIGLTLFFVSGTLILLSFCGQAIIFTRRDRRGLPDLMAKTVVIRRGTAKAEDADLDEEERQRLERSAARRVRNVALFDVLLIAGAIGVPYLMSVPSTSAADFAARVRRASVEQAFNANPANPSAAAELIYLLQETGERDRANEIETRHREAVEKQRSTQEQALKSAIARDPRSWDNVESLIALYEREERTEEAKRVYEAFVAADPTAENRVGLGIWLYEHELYPGAIAELSRAIRDGAETAEPHAYLGWSYLQLEKLSEARAELERALEIEPDLEDVQRDLDATIDRIEGKQPDSP
jgi:uncharacterized RDD family membrane protein YckC